jgi:hypothetical protein
MVGPSLSSVMTKTFLKRVVHDTIPYNIFLCVFYTYFLLHTITPHLTLKVGMSSISILLISTLYQKQKVGRKKGKKGGAKGREKGGGRENGRGSERKGGGKRKKGKRGGSKER